MKLEGKRVVITGGGSGIGESAAHCLAAEGCRIVIAGRSEEKLRRVAGACKGPGEIIARVVDVADRQSTDSLFEWATEQLGGIDIVVHSAGINIPNRTFAEMPPEKWDEILAIIATGTYNCLHAVLPAMRAQRDGLFVNISSVAGIRAAMLSGPAYTAAKFAQSGLALAAALEAGPDQVRITNIYPGEVDTPILKDRPTPVSAEHRARILQPEDVAQAVLCVACLPPRAHIVELVIKPTSQEFG